MSPRYIEKSRKVFIQDKEVLADIEIWRRTGWKSPSTYIIKHNGRRYAPIMWEKYRIDIPIPTALFLIYAGPTLKSLVYDKNPFFNLLKNNNKDSFGGEVFPVPTMSLR